MAKKIVCVGRGGVGKTSFIGGASLILRSYKPLLIIDADPDESLAQSLGIPKEAKAISDILFDIKEGVISDQAKSFTLPERIDYLIQQDALYEADYFDFLSVGVKWTQGCYCQPNNILKSILKRFEKNYNFILIDSPAGLEHINRRITSSVDYIFILVDPSRKSLDGIVRFNKLLKELKIEFGHMYVVANYRFSSKDLHLVKEKTGYEALGRLPYDKAIEEANLKGIQFNELDAGNQFLSQIKQILQKVGILNTACA